MISVDGPKWSQEIFNIYITARPDLSITPVYVVRSYVATRVNPKGTVDTAGFLTNIPETIDFIRKRTLLRREISKNHAIYLKYDYKDSNLGDRTKSESSRDLDERERLQLQKGLEAELSTSL